MNWRSFLSLSWLLTLHFLTQGIQTKVNTHGIMEESWKKRVWYYKLLQIFKKAPILKVCCNLNDWMSRLTCRVPGWSWCGACATISARSWHPWRGWASSRRQTGTGRSLWSCCAAATAPAMQCVQKKKEMRLIEIGDMSFCSACYYKYYYL